MPIYAYKCSACGHAADVLQKLSDAPLTVCPHCGQAAYAKQVTAAGFQLKGSGWYVTDFRGNGTGGGAPAKPADSTASPASSDVAKPSGDSGAAAAPAAAPPAAPTSSST